MLTGKKCKVGTHSNRAHRDFTFYDAIIASEAQLSEPEEFRVVVLKGGKLITVDTYFIYDVED